MKNPFALVRLRVACMLFLIVLALLWMPLAAYAQTAVAPVDPIGLITAVAGSLPGVAKYLPMILAYLSMAGGICVAITIYVPTPTSASPSWWLSVYKVISFMAGNFGHARNAVAPGMQPEVAVAALTSAKATAAAPEQAVVAGVTTIATAVIKPGGVTGTPVPPATPVAAVAISPPPQTPAT